MQQLVIKLSPQATEQYLKIAAPESQSTTSEVQIDINMALMAGLCFTDIGVNGQSISTATDDEDLQLELVEVN